MPSGIAPLSNGSYDAPTSARGSKHRPDILMTHMGPVMPSSRDVPRVPQPTSSPLPPPGPMSTPTPMPAAAASPVMARAAAEPDLRRTHMGPVKVPPVQSPMVPPSNGVAQGNGQPMPRAPDQSTRVSAGAQGSSQAVASPGADVVPKLRGRSKPADEVAGAPLGSGPTIQAGSPVARGGLNGTPAQAPPAPDVRSFVATPPRGDAAVFYSKPNELVGTWSAGSDPEPPEAVADAGSGKAPNNYLSGLVEAALEQARGGVLPGRPDRQQGAAAGTASPGSSLQAQGAAVAPSRVGGAGQPPNVQVPQQGGTQVDGGVGRSAEAPLPRAPKGGGSVGDGPTPVASPARADATAPAATAVKTQGPVPSANETTQQMKSVAAKVQAARQLARRLAEAKQAAMASAEQQLDSQAKRRAEQASMAAAEQAARTDAILRAVQRSERNAEASQPMMRGLQEEIMALRRLCVDLAKDKDDAEKKVRALQRRVQNSEDVTQSPFGTIDVDPQAPDTVAPTPNRLAAISDRALQQIKEVKQQLSATDTRTPSAAGAAPAQGQASGAQIAGVEERGGDAAQLATQAGAEAASGGNGAQPDASPEAEELRLGREQLKKLREAAEKELQEAAERDAERKRQQQIAKETPAQKMARFAMDQRRQGVSHAVYAPDGATPGNHVTLLYDVARSPLPERAAPVLKGGFNRWESIVELPMQAANFEFPQKGDWGTWYKVGIDLPHDIFELVYVVYDRNSNVYDNNGGIDFQMTLVDVPTEEEVIEGRARRMELLEQERLRLSAESDAAELAAAETTAAQIAEQARVDYRTNRTAELEQQALKIVRDRRSLEGGSSVTFRIEGVYEWVGGNPKAGMNAKLVYNRDAGPLRHGNSVSVHVGYDGWWMKDMNMYPMSKLSGEAAAQMGVRGRTGQWWGVELTVPFNASVLDFVFSDAEGRVWDNNNMKDYHVQVSNPTSDTEVMRQTLEQLAAETKETDKAEEERVAAAAYKRVLQKVRTTTRRRRANSRNLYTIPFKPLPSAPLILRYNPDSTPLSGQRSISARLGFNGWQHGTLQGPTRMTSLIQAGRGWHEMEVVVPKDAAVMDLEFVGEVWSADMKGLKDDNDGNGYHVAIGDHSDESVRTDGRRLRIVHITVEMAPIAKVGGLADVVTSLGRAVQDEGHDVSVVLPKYDCLDYSSVRGLREVDSFRHENVKVKVWEGFVEGLHVVFLEPDNGFFWVGCIYGRGDDAHRFGFFSHAATAYFQHSRIEVDIVHCHDWQTAPASWGPRGQAKCVFTIHNLQYGTDQIGRAMGACDAATTVSPTYASEISGHPAVAHHISKLHGIVNGIDAAIWDPASDRYIPSHYTDANAEEGKAAARSELRGRFAMVDQDVPMVGVVTRLTHQKGIHLIKHAAWRVLERGGQFVLLGAAPDGRVQGEFNALANDLARAFPNRSAFQFTYDEPLSHLIYAACHMMLVPSMFEPCGLTQLIAMRYGAIPVVRKTGGLTDTVFDVENDQQRAAEYGLLPNGFNFEGPDETGMDYGLDRALASWYSDQDEWQRLQQQVMQQDWSWNGPGYDYLELYYKALGE